ncbi:MAG: Stk1 family PASTA domain-containing Ser/Thr kinase [Erysipelotrichaceae bacterium]|nr:Stk1 family PASTA domain-containing Ser/Thr kinase [Erysipelotrichaceae bacterium]
MSEMIKNRYMIVSRLGEGGMADVYLAVDTLLNREVAIKVLRGELSTDHVSLLRFKREANAASTLNHPNIVEIYDVGEEAGKHFIVMEVVRGKTLKQLISQRGAMEKEEALAIMKQLIVAVSEAHRKNIIHRDIKPQNVLIKDDGTVKITDFGIALAQDAMQLTQTDAVMGSVHYLAPECARGEAASNQSDVYSLGIVLYELLRGDVPFTGEAPVQIAIKHMREDIPSIREFNPTLPQSLENIIIKATAKNKLLRYQSAKDMSDDLLTCLSAARAKEAKVIFVDDDAEGSTTVINQVATSEPVVESKSTFATVSAALTISALVILIGFAIFTMFNPGTIESRYTNVPDLSGLNYSEAKLALEEKGLTLSSNVLYTLTEDIQAGKIISFTPTFGTQVEKGSLVTITVSEGIYYVVADFTTKTLEEARAMLSGTRITIRSENEPSLTVTPGTIIRQELLLAGDKLDPRRSYEIKLVVASYVEWVVPQSIIGMGIGEASRMIEELGLKVMTVKLSTAELSEEELAKIVYNVVESVSPGVGSLYIQYEDSTVILYYY